MGKDSKIEWTHHTFNPWWGCQKVSPGCANCYAESFDKRVHGAEKAHWGPGSSRRMFGEKHWNEPLKWDKDAADSGERHRVFCASMADVFEDHPDVADSRARLYALILETPNLDWLLLTKRPENAERLWGLARIDAFGTGLLDSTEGPLWPDNVWLGTSVENQEQADIRIPVLAKIPARVRFLSMEPLLGPVDLMPLLTEPTGKFRTFEGRRQMEVATTGAIRWVIVGGESGRGARPMQADWARGIRDQCQQLAIAFHFKQWGEHDSGLVRVGKKAAGRVLDGRAWDGLPH